MADHEKHTRSTNVDGAAILSGTLNLNYRKTRTPFATVYSLTAFLAGSVEGRGRFRVEG
ncbi:hypothetical protein J6590_029888 [Homalodisca vitripennis]|nr:hypothetical protein J6590_029888 [Homalodisca vitripennis]